MKLAPKLMMAMNSCGAWKKTAWDVHGVASNLEDKRFEVNNSLVSCERRRILKGGKKETVVFAFEDKCSSC